MKSDSRQPSTPSLKSGAFLTIDDRVEGSCRIPADVARRIRDVCIGASEPLILAPEHPSVELLARKVRESYVIYLGDPDQKTTLPTLREFLDLMGYWPVNEVSLLRYLAEWRGHKPRLHGPAHAALCELRRMLDEPIQGLERDHWIKSGRGSTQDADERAFRYLRDLPLDDGRARKGHDFGRLYFLEFEWYRSPYRSAHAENLAVIAALQHRLNELNTGAAIRIE